MKKDKELLMKKQIKDTILSENAITVGNMNDYANLALRINASDNNALNKFFEENLTEEGAKYKVVISTDNDQHADCSYMDKKGKIYAHFYKVK